MAFAYKYWEWPRTSSVSTDGLRVDMWSRYKQNTKQTWRSGSWYPPTIPQGLTTQKINIDTFRPLNSIHYCSNAWCERKTYTSISTPPPTSGSLDWGQLIWKPGVLSFKWVMSFFRRELWLNPHPIHSSEHKVLELFLAAVTPSFKRNMWREHLDSRIAIKYS